MDLILKNARVAGRHDGQPVDIGIDGGRIAAIEPGLSADAEVLDIGGRLVGPGFVETHIHLDKSCILERCESTRGDLEEAIEQVAQAKREFTAEDCRERAVRTLEKCLRHGTTHMRTHLEVDPVIGLRSLEGIMPLIDEYRWAIDLEICVFPQEGLLNNPGTDELMVEGLKRGCRVVGAAPYTDTDPKGQIDRVFEMAREFDVDIDMHLDFGPDHDELDIFHVCRLAERYGYEGRVAVGHVTKLSTMPMDRLDEVARMAAGAGVAVTVLPSTDLFLMGRHMEHDVMRGVTPNPPDDRARGQLRPLVQQRPQSLHPLRRLLPHPHGQPLRQRLPRRKARRHRGVPQHGDGAGGPPRADRELRGSRWATTPTFVVHDCEDPGGGGRRAGAPRSPASSGAGGRSLREPVVLHRPG